MTSSRIRVIDLETAGNGQYDVCEIGWQDVVQGNGGLWSLSDERGALFVNPGRPISPETMAVHHIIDEYVADAPFWKDVAPDVLQPDAAVVALAAHRSAFEQRYCTPRLTGGAQWICTWKCSLRVWPELQSFSNQMLRYQRMPIGLIHELGLPAHRAMPDAYVTAHHLRDMLNVASVDQLLAWSKEPGLLPRVPSGADRGKSWQDIGEVSLDAYAGDRDVDVRFSAETELQRRGRGAVSGLVAPAQGRLL
ncbi:exonuclease domain-containing protein [Devosia sp. LjRoot3]|uniref:exonuclease domain-containing protein n=1 Tax=Devosia sp. LjRoot3 TaxID=3342319 RepID=UPI003ECDCC22